MVSVPDARERIREGKTLSVHVVYLTIHLIFSISHAGTEYFYKRKTLHVYSLEWLIFSINGMLFAWPPQSNVAEFT